MTDGPPYDEMVIIECNSQPHCTVDTAEMSSTMYTCHDHVTNVIQATYLCLPGDNVTPTNTYITTTLCFFVAKTAVTAS